MPASSQFHIIRFSMFSVVLYFLLNDLMNKTTGTVLERQLSQEILKLKKKGSGFLLFYCFVNVFTCKYYPNLMI